MFSKPDFLVVGPKKTGTTWLYNQFRKTAGIRVTPFKEVSFFYDADVNRLLNAFKDEENIRKFLGNSAAPEEVIAKVRQNQKKRVATFKAKMKRNFRETWKRRFRAWAIFFYIIPRRFNWLSIYLYTLLFKKEKGEVAGDVSPEYFALSPEGIAQVKKYFPNIKIIFIIRDPTERDWSQIRMNHFKNPNSPPFIIEEYLLHRNWDGDYQLAINNWGQQFTQEQILYVFYDELESNPEGFMAKILRFLNPEAKIKQLVTERVGEGVSKGIEPHAQSLLFYRNLKQYEFMAEKFGKDSYPAKWLEKYKAITAQ
jgi:hypothetical protein